MSLTRQSFNEKLETPVKVRVLRSFYWWPVGAKESELVEGENEEVVANIRNGKKEPSKAIKKVFATIPKWLAIELKAAQKVEFAQDDKEVEIEAEEPEKKSK